MALVTSLAKVIQPSEWYTFQLFSWYIFQLLFTVYWRSPLGIELKRACGGGAVEFAGDGGLAVLAEGTSGNSEMADQDNL